jgi:phosphopantetheinyl transferase
MLKSFYIGLSLMSSLYTQTAAEWREKRSAEGLRIVSLLDITATPLASPGKAISNDFIAREPGGRPYFSDYHADFSISHSRNMVAAALLSAASEGASGVSPGRIGCDIQYCNPGKSCVEISRRFFHACEQAYIEEYPAVQLQRFYRIWVLKEAWLKLHGLSVFDMPKAPAFCIGGDPQIAAKKSETVYFLYELSSTDVSESYMLAEACQRIHSGGESEPEPEIRWFSDTTLTLNRVENIYAAHSPENTVMPNI